jgi:hypothetical protein
VFIVLQFTNLCISVKCQLEVHSVCGEAGSELLNIIDLILGFQNFKYSNIKVRPHVAIHGMQERLHLKAQKPSYSL